MKKPLLISLTALAVLGVTTATTLYAQTTTGSSVIARMKAAATAFTLSADLNPGQTGFESAPVSWKKTGNILTAAEWNRMLELVAQGGGGSGGTSNITWANFDGSGGVTMKWSNGISSIVRESAGNYRVTFVTPRPNADYGIICTSGPSPSYLCFPNDKSTTSFLIKTSNPTNNIDAPFVSLIVTPFDVWGSSGSSSPLFYYCTNAQSLDSTNAPCYGASRNGGAGTNQYRVVSCTDNDGTRSYTMSSILNFWQLVTNKWAVSVNGGTIECDDGTVLVMDIQGVGSSGGGSSSSSVIACKKKNSTYSTSTLTGQPLVKFTASDCGWVLPDASYNGAIGSLNVCNGAIDHTVYSADAVDGPWVSFSFRGWYACTWPDGNGYDISVIYMK